MSRQDPLKKKFFFGGTLILFPYINFHSASFIEILKINFFKLDKSAVRDSGNGYDHFSFPFLEFRPQITELSCHDPTGEQKILSPILYINHYSHFSFSYLIFYVVPSHFKELGMFRSKNNVFWKIIIQKTKINTFFRCFRIIYSHYLTQIILHKTLKYINTKSGLNSLANQFYSLND